MVTFVYPDDPRNPGKPAEAGFTLIEMLVALAIFGLACLTLLRLEGAMVSTAASLHEKILGQIVARNIAVEALQDPLPPARGTSSGVEVNAGLRWQWERTIQSAVQPGLQQIDISVRDQTGQTISRLTLFREGQ
jgi:general secretion pathway protein I